MKVTNLTGNVTRRRFLSGTAGVIATGVAVPMSQEAVEGLNESISLEQMASALHEAVGRYSDRNAPFFNQSRLPPKNPSLDFAMENLRHWSVDEIQYLLKSLFEKTTNQ